MLAAGKGKKDMVKFLLQKGASLEAKDNLGIPLAWAVNNCQLDCVDILKDESVLHEENKANQDVFDITLIRLKSATFDGPCATSGEIDQLLQILKLLKDALNADQERLNIAVCVFFIIYQALVFKLI